jgi:hypothetical protein
LIRERQSLEIVALLERKAARQQLRDQEYELINKATTEGFENTQALSTNHNMSESTQRPRIRNLYVSTVLNETICSANRSPLFSGYLNNLSPFSSTPQKLQRKEES